MTIIYTINVPVNSQLTDEVVINVEDMVQDYLSALYKLSDGECVTMGCPYEHSYAPQLKQGEE